MLDRGPREPPLLLLRAPQERDDGAGLPPLGYFEICASAQARLAGVKAKEAGWSW
jgi:hypothetical protein